jgi:hypothetical protein
MTQQRALPAIRFEQDASDNNEQASALRSRVFIGPPYDYWFKKTHSFSLTKLRTTDSDVNLSPTLNSDTLSTTHQSFSTQYHPQGSIRGTFSNRKHSMGRESILSPNIHTNNNLNLL